MGRWEGDGEDKEIANRLGEMNETLKEAISEWFPWEICFIIISTWGAPNSAYAAAAIGTRPPTLLVMLLAQMLKSRQISGAHAIDPVTHLHTHSRVESASTRNRRQAAAGIGLLVRSN